MTNEATELTRLREKLVAVEKLIPSWKARLIPPEHHLGAYEISLATAVENGLNLAADELQQVLNEH